MPPVTGPGGPPDDDFEEIPAGDDRFDGPRRSGRDPVDVDDPLERLERNERSSRHAVLYVLASAAFVLVVALLLSLSLDFDAVPCPGYGRLCTSAPRVEFVIIPTGICIVLTGYAMWETYRRWRDHVRWRPWLFACQIMWILTTGYLLVAASIAFVGA